MLLLHRMGVIRRRYLHVLCSDSDASPLLDVKPATFVFRGRLQTVCLCTKGECTPENMACGHDSTSQELAGKITVLHNSLQ